MGVATAALALGGAALSASGASANNSAVRRSARSASRNAQSTLNRTSRRNAVERVRNRLEADKVLGRVRVTSSSRGAALGTSFDRSVRQVEIDEGLNDRILRDNFADDSAAISSGLEAQLVALEARLQSVALAGISGGIQGGLAGLTLGEGLEGLAGGTPAAPTASLTNGPASAGLVQLPDLAGPGVGTFA